MTMHIQKFVDRVCGQEARGARELSMTMQEAKDLHADITRLLVALQSLQQQNIQTNTSESVTQVKIHGGTFK